MTYQLPPQVIHDIVSALPTRLKKRAESLAGDSGLWTITPDPLTVVIGSNTVSFTEGTLSCDCLLSPKCAHCGAVALAAEISEATPEVTQTPTQQADEHPEVSETTTVAQQEALKAAFVLIEPVLEKLVMYGIPALNPLGYAQLVAALHHARTNKLHRLERSLTAVVTLRTQCRFADKRARPRRQALAQAFGGLLEIAYLVAHQPENPATVGVARRVYEELTPGRDDGTFTPVYAEPVVTDSGFAGAVVTFADKSGKLFTVGKTPPGRIDGVARAWRGPVQLGDINTTLAELSMRTVIISGGSVSADGRIGAGKKIRAAQGRDVLFEHVAAIPGVECVSGEVSYADFTKVSLKEGKDYVFSPTAQRCGVAGLVAKMLNMEVNLIVRDRVIRAVWIGEKRFIPGLDARGADVVTVSSTGQLGNIDPTPRMIVASWVQRIALRGKLGIHREQLIKDISLLKEMTAPTAAELLQRLSTQCDRRTVTALAFYASAQ